MELIAPTLMRPVNRDTVAMIAMAISNFQRMLQARRAINRASGLVAKRSKRHKTPSRSITDTMPKPAFANRSPAPHKLRGKISCLRPILIR